MDYIGMFTFGFICAAAMSANVVYKSELEHYDRTTELIKQCQAELPRNQKCVLKAVPEESEDE